MGHKRRGNFSPRSACSESKAERRFHGKNECSYIAVLPRAVSGTSLKGEAQTWSFTGNMPVGRTYHTATLLNNGEVLVAGGRGVGDPDITSAELYNPSTGTFSFRGEPEPGAREHCGSAAANKSRSSGCWGGFLGGLVQLKHAARPSHTARQKCG